MWSRLLFTVFNLLLVSVAFAQIGSVGLIGSATPGGWDADTDMVRISDDEWRLEITLIDGFAKFRADDAWDINWGASDFPAGTGIQGGPDIPVVAGDYVVTFNSATGEYLFDVDSDISIIGDATPGGWDNDTKMYQDQADSNKYFLEVDLVAGGLKFRTTGSWDVNWGSADFPAGVGTQNGENIPIPGALTYRIDFDKSTGEYLFSEIISFTAIGLIGAATPGGWDTDTPLNRDAGNPDIWRGTVTMTDGEFKFRANNDWAINWGGTDFPVGVGVLNGDNIVATAGDYLVTFNTATAEYSFLLIGNYSSIGIIGDATPGGWDNETGMEQDANDVSIWRLRAILTDGELKFRADNDWAINWGSGDFPTGTGVQDGANIPVVAGEYKITFNSTTGAYSFELLVIFNTVGMIGPGSPTAGWDTDFDMTKDLVDESFWYVPSVDLNTGEMKFRAEDAWTVNWGAVDFPSGVGTQDGPNIPVVAGTYRVELHTVTGEYSFSEPSSTTSVLKSDIISIFPNPARDVINLEFKSDLFRGEARVSIFSMKGEMVHSQTMNLLPVNVIPAQNLPAGTYILQIANDKYVVGKQVIIAK
jgi:hypothetical protein